MAASDQDDHRTPAELIARSKEKYALGIARIRREHYTLALLSLHGSLEDGLRAHLQLHHHPAGSGDWDTILDTLAKAVDQDEKPVTRLTPVEAERLRRIDKLWRKARRGEHITILDEHIQVYQQLVAQLLLRYDIIVVAPETTTSATKRIEYRELARSTPTFWQRYRTHLAPTVTVILMFVIGAAVSIAVQQSRSQPAPVPTTTVRSSITTPATLEAQPTYATARRPTIAPTPHLSPGRDAYVRDGISEGLALRAQPGTTDDIPILLYLEPNTAVRVIGGPVEADGYTWWQVRAANQTGWCAGEFLEMR